MPLRLDNAIALPTCPQQRQKKKNRLKSRFQIDHAASPMPENQPARTPRRWARSNRKGGRHRLGIHGRLHIGTPGRLRRNPQRCRLPGESKGQKPTLSRPLSLLSADLAMAMSASNSSRIVLASRRTLQPARVGRTPPLCRSKRAIPKWCSSSAILRLRLDCCDLTNSAAPRKLPQSAAATADLRCLSSIAL